jgi:hypothetical protein
MIMKTIRPLAAVMLFAAIFTFSSCIFDDPQPQLTQEFSLKNFTEIDLGDAFQIEIKKGDDFKVTAAGEKDDIHDLVLEVVNGKLTGHYRPGSKNHGHTSICIVLPELTIARLHSATSTTLRGFNDADETLSFEVSGAATLTGDILCKKLNLEVSGASTATLTGTADRMDTEVSGKSVLKTAQLKLKICDANVSGKSDAVVHATEELRGIVNGKSSLTYYGNPASVDVGVANDSDLIKK